MQGGSDALLEGLDVSSSTGVGVGVEGAAPTLQRCRCGWLGDPGLFLNNVVAIIHRISNFGWAHPNRVLSQAVFRKGCGRASEEWSGARSALLNLGIQRAHRIAFGVGVEGAAPTLERCRWGAGGPGPSLRPGPTRPDLF